MGRSLQGMFGSRRVFAVSISTEILIVNFHFGGMEIRDKQTRSCSRGAKRRTLVNCFLTPVINRDYSRSR